MKNRLTDSAGQVTIDLHRGLHAVLSPPGYGLNARARSSP